jgi:6-phosphogluconolactonase
VEFEVLARSEEVARRCAQEVETALGDGMRTLVLAGGETPRLAYEWLARRPVAWGRVAVLFEDERCVPPDDDQSNYLMARRSLLDRVAPASVHRIPAELGGDAAAAAYDAVVAALEPLDVVVLGVGPDGHTASLFPGHPALSASGRTVAVHGAPKPPPERVSLTLPVLRAARVVLVLATGSDKAEAVARASRGEVPAGMIPQARWLVDAEAAAGL